MEHRQFRVSTTLPAEIIVKVDPGYPDDPALLATITDGFFKVMDRRTGR